MDTVTWGVRISSLRKKTNAGHTAMISKTPEFDPRTDRAQTVEGAKARYIQQDTYSLDDLEADVERLLEEGEYPDTSPVETFTMDVGYV
jgi:hypothetical protein